MGACDPYALVVFESTAARTNAWRSTRRPRWTPDAPRAFRFPVKSPYSNIYVGMRDHDSMLGQDIQDDDIGALTLGLSLASAWHETQYSRLFRS